MRDPREEWFELPHARRAGRVVDGGERGRYTRAEVPAVRRIRDLGGWIAHRELDTSTGRRGRGSASVLPVTRDDRSYFAMNIPHRQSREDEPYQRFENEVRILNELRGRPGAVEVIDSRLPERPEGPAGLLRDAHHAPGQGGGKEAAGAS